MKRYKRFLLYEAMGLIAYALVTLGHWQDFKWNMTQFAAYTLGVLWAMVNDALSRLKPEE